MAKQESRKEITPWRPFQGLAAWESDFERTLEDFFGRRLAGPFGGFPRALGASAPAVDVYEEKDEVVAKAELPGLEKNDIEVNVIDHQLTIKGEKKQEREIEEKNFYRAERSYGAFFRTIELPAEVESDKAKAAFKNGVLEIHIPKTEEAKKKHKQVRIE
ncbi:MAG TPA: Hsp20/alpha crystallin family protein [Verrucomicrobiae bacterium]|nr:Hsp20/alpha crystallin family protein [Verrucomicrobiae bacterium]